jgi:hypothetical protein
MTGIPGRDLVGLLGISGVQEIVLHASSLPAEQMKQGILCTFADPN